MSAFGSISSAFRISKFVSAVGVGLMLAACQGGGASSSSDSSSGSSSTSYPARLEGGTLMTMGLQGNVKLQGSANGTVVTGAKIYSPTSNHYQSNREIRYKVDTDNRTFSLQVYNDFGNRTFVFDANSNLVSGTNAGESALLIPVSSINGTVALVLLQKYCATCDWNIYTAYSGTAATNIPTSGTATYAGIFNGAIFSQGSDPAGAAAKGTLQMAMNFGTGAYSGVITAGANTLNFDGTLALGSNSQFGTSSVKLNGAAGSGYVSGQFFGNGANEVAGTAGVVSADGKTGVVGAFGGTKQ